MTCFWGKGVTHPWNKQQRPVHKFQDTTVCDGLSSGPLLLQLSQAQPLLAPQGRLLVLQVRGRLCLFTRLNANTLSHTHAHMHTRCLPLLPPLCLSLTLTPLYPFNFRLSLKPAVCWHIQVCWCCYWHVRVMCVWVCALCELVPRLRHAGFTES